MDEMLTEVTNSYSLPEIIEAYGFSLKEEQDNEWGKQMRYKKDNITVIITRE